MSRDSAAQGGAGVGPSRRQWDVEAYTTRARERDRQHRERAIEEEERKKQGKAPLGRRRHDTLPKPTKAMQTHDGLELDANLGTTMVEDASGGQRAPGYFCELCKRMCKDSVGYLDHINGRMHLRRLGQSTQTELSSLEQVQKKLAEIREQRALGKSAADRYDFQARIRQIAEEQRKEHEAKQQQRRQDRLRRKQEKNDHTNGSTQEPTPEDQAMMAAMGFATFGSSR
ncbi:U4/U6.U5 snRNP associated protein [Malassezia yamatoensis]|uniref:U4/U6.U5 snRNP associated protein n=1 Tax=Malassezia yamatoensis TaxID=253288 RepID=A0AAJ6CKI1_9BASI|nr:U4/U6.U5 snRNP associated protein [Malassezia yamatoensis]